MQYTTPHGKTQAFLLQLALDSVIFFLYLARLSCYNKRVIIGLAHRRQLERRPATDVKFEKWNIGTPDPQAVDRLREAGYSDLLSTVLAARGVGSAE